MCLRAIALGDSFVQSHRPIEGRRATKPRNAIDERKLLEGTKHQPMLHHRVFKKIPKHFFTAVVDISEGQ